MKNLCTAMAAAFPEIEGATKDSTNPHFKSKYADLGSVVEAIKPALIKNGLFFGQVMHEQDGGVCVETLVCHSSGEQMSFGKLFVPASKQDAQGYGSALTYARRYSLMAAFGVAPEDDDGNAAVKSQPKPANNDAPFPQGPCRNKTELKEKGRAFWRDVEACDDPDQLEALLGSHKDLTEQIAKALPQWWLGFERNGEKEDGLSTVILKKQTELSIANPDWRANPLLAG